MTITMLRFLRRNAVAFVALTLVLGGTAYAAKRVGGDDLKPFDVQTQERQLKPGQAKFVKAKCEKEHRYISGGFTFGFADESPAKVTVESSGPFLTGKKAQVPRGHEVLVINEGDEKQLITVNAVCLKS